MDVDPKTLLFTQDSIKNTFKAPREDERIDDAVDAILSGELEASDFPALSVVSYDGRFWSLDNRRLWVFKKAGVPSITVKLKSPKANPRFTELITRNQPLVKRILKPGYWPRVRGNCRSSFHRPVQNLYSYLPVEPKPQFGSTSEADDVYYYNSSYDNVFPSLHSARKVGPVPRVLGEWFPDHLASSTSAGNAEPHPAVKALGARENNPTAAEKSSEGEKPEVACVLHDGIEVRMPPAEDINLKVDLKAELVLLDQNQTYLHAMPKFGFKEQNEVRMPAAEDIDFKVDLKAELVLLDQNQTYLHAMPKFGFKEQKEVVEAKKDKSVGNCGTRVEEKGVTSTENDAVIGTVQGPVEVYALRAPCDGGLGGSSHWDCTNAVNVPEAAACSSGLGAHAHAEVQMHIDRYPPQSFTFPEGESYSRSRSSWGLRKLLETCAKFVKTCAKFVKNVAQSAVIIFKDTVDKLLSFTKRAWSTASSFFAKRS